MRSERPGRSKVARLVRRPPSHVAPLGLVFDTGKGLLESYSGGAFGGGHGSWNQQILNGYKVIFVPFKDGKPNEMPQDVVTGFFN